ncbi:MAG: radical SAM protein [Deltaproteobacteria bacterium]|jgi:hypothetical protein|nr:radical SAM protein [Deltaproteobacteria bacterium]
MPSAHKILTRSHLESELDPNQRLIEILGDGFAAYRLAFAQAEAGERPEAPIHLDVDVTTVCQLRCPMCPAGRPEDNHFPGFGIFMDKKIFMEALKQAQSFGLKSLRLGMTGEPLLIESIDQWVAAAADYGLLDISLITNGQLLTYEKSLKLIKAGLTRLMISVDAATSETYAKVRPKGDFERLEKNIRDFWRAKSALASPLPLLRLSFVITKQNAGEMGLFREKFSQQADYLTFQNYLDIMGDHGQTKVQGTGQSLSGRLDDSASGPPKSSPEPASGGTCLDPLTRLAIMADGGLFPCCSDFGRLAPLGWFPKNSLLEVWNSPEAQNLTHNPFHQSCRKCRAASLSPSPKAAAA